MPYQRRASLSHFSRGLRLLSSNRSQVEARLIALQNLYRHHGSQNQAKHLLWVLPSWPAIWVLTHQSSNCQRERQAHQPLVPLNQLDLADYHLTAIQERMLQRPTVLHFGPHQQLRCHLSKQMLLGSAPLLPCLQRRCRPAPEHLVTANPNSATFFSRNLLQQIDS